MLIWLMSLIIGGQPSFPSGSQAPLAPLPDGVRELTDDNCGDLDATGVASCCTAWVEENNLSLPECLGSWRWSEETGCSFICGGE